MLGMLFLAFSSHAIVVSSGIDSDIYHYMDMPPSSTNDLGVSFGGPFFPGGDDHSQTSLVKFDLNGFSGTADSATLRLNTARITSAFGSGFSSGNMLVSANTTDWSINAFGPPSAQTPKLANANPGIAAGALVITSQNTWYDIDVTTIVNSWLAGSANYGFVLQAPNPGLNTVFNSFEVAGYGPQLVIEGEALSVVPEPSTYGLIIGLLASIYLIVKRKK